MAVLDPTSGQVRYYQYEALGVAAHPIDVLPSGIERVTPAPGAVWLRHIVAMVADGQGHLWYVRAGSDTIEEVAA